jgi:phage-related minor tail protein
MADAERIIRLVVDAQKAQADIAKFGNSVQGIDTKLTRAGSAMKAFGAGLAGAFSVGAIVSGITSLVSTLGDLGEAAESIGLTTRQLQEFQAIGEQAGVSAEKMQVAFQRLSTVVDDFGSGGTKTTKLLKELGADLEGMSNSDAFGKLADLFQKLPDGASKTALAMEIFGKSGAALIPILNQGKDALEKNRQELEKLGIIIDDKAIAAADKLADSWSLLVRQGKSALTNALEPMVSKIAEMVVEFNRARAAGLSFLQSFGRDATETAEQIQAQINTIEYTARGLGGLMSEATKRELEYLKARLANVNAQKAAAAAAAEIAKKAAASGSAEDPIAAARKRLATGSGKSSGADAAQRAREAEIKEYAALTLQLEKLQSPMSAVAELERRIALDMETGSERVLSRKRAIAELTDATKALEAAERDRQKRLDQALSEAEKQARLDDEKRENARLYREEFAKFMEQFGDPKVAAMKRVNDQIAQLNKYMMEGRVPAEEYFDRLERIQNGGASVVHSLEAMKTPLDLINEGFNGFFDNLARGTASASDLFKRMVQSILANVAKLALNKFFVSLFGDSLGLKLGDGGMSIVGRKANGAAYGSSIGWPQGVYTTPHFFAEPGRGALSRYAKGAVFAEAGPEAIMPLRRGRDGRLGVESQAPVVNVNVVNNAGAQVRTEQNGNDITIYIEQVKAAIARDIRAGAGAVTAAMQGTYGLNRAAGAR